MLWARAQDGGAPVPWLGVSIGVSKAGEEGAALAALRDENPLLADGAGQPPNQGEWAGSTVPAKVHAWLAHEQRLAPAGSKYVDLCRLLRWLGERLQEPVRPGGPPPGSPTSGPAAATTAPNQTLSVEAALSKPNKIDTPK